MTASQWQMTGVILLVLGAGFLAISQILLSRWHEKIINE